MPYLLIIGAKSDIAKAVAMKYAENGYDLYLAARNATECKDLAKDLEIRTQRNVQCLEFDILDYPSHQDFYHSLEITPVGVICAVGYLGDQNQAQNDFYEAQKIINTNYTGVVSIFNVIAEHFIKQKQGFIVGVSSVAGDRGRKSNYFYGSAKAALSAYLSGLRNRLADSNVQVLTVKPGFVATKMTAGMNLPQKLTIQPDQMAKAIYEAQLKGKDILYAGWIWRWIMLIINHIPEWKFKYLNI